MTKLSVTGKRTLSQEPDIEIEHYDSDHSPLFIEQIRKAAGLTRKDFQYGLRVSKTLAKAWFEGTRHDPLTRARDVVAFFRTEKKVWLIPVILAWIAGNTEFDGRILTGEENQLLSKIAAIVEKKP